MHSDVHLAALSAAARVAFGVAVLGGCSGAVQSGEKGADEAAYSESAVNADPPCHDPPDASKEPATPPDATAPSCDDVIAAGFPGVNPDDYVWEKKADASAELTACCTQKLVETQGMMPYRFHCCTATDDPAVGIACTPWGPPVPPRMRGVA